MIKICTKCGQEKDVSFFSKDSTKKDGLCSRCKLCTYIYQKTYCRKNTEKHKCQVKLWREKNKDRIRIYKKKSVKKDKALVLTYAFFNNRRLKRSDVPKELFELVKKQKELSILLKEKNK